MDKTISNLFDGNFHGYPATNRFDTFYALVPSNRLRDILYQQLVELKEKNYKYKELLRESFNRSLGGLDTLDMVVPDPSSYYVLFVSDSNMFTSFVYLPTVSVINKLKHQKSNPDELAFLSRLTNALIQKSLIL